MPNPSSSMLEPRFDHARDWFEEARIKVRACSDQFEHSRTKVRACSNQGFGSEGPGLVLGFRWVYEVLRLSTHIEYVRTCYERTYVVVGYACVFKLRITTVQISVAAQFLEEIWGIAAVAVGRCASMVASFLSPAALHARSCFIYVCCATYSMCMEVQ